MKFIETDIKEIKEQLMWNRQYGHKAVFLLGSGMSVSAGIPDSEGIIARIRRDFSSVCARMHPVTYEDHLAILTPSQRQELIRSYVDGARLNPAHLYMASAIKNGFADLVFTTNFDNLIQRALLLENIFPKVVDFLQVNESQNLELSGISVVHLNGQKDGTLPFQAEEDFHHYEQKIKRYFSEYFENRTVIVVGYAGADDPLISYLSSVRTFGNRLYWIGYGSEEPDTNVVQNVLQRSTKHACFVKSKDADQFFIDLNSALNIPAPRVLYNPLDFVAEMMGTMSSAPPVFQETTPILPRIEIPPIVAFEPEAEKGVEKEGTEVIQDEDKIEELQAREGEITEKDSELLNFAKHSFSNHLWSNYAELKERIASSEDKEAINYFALFLMAWGLDLEKNADAETSTKEAETIYQNACSKLEEATATNSNFADAFNHLGICLGKIAVLKGAEDADKIYADAYEKFDVAVSLEPGELEFYKNWADLLIKHAETKGEVEGQKLYFAAFEKFKFVLKNKPDQADIYDRWGTCLTNLALLKRDDEAEVIINDAGQKFSQAVKLNPEFDSAYVNWGLSLRVLAKNKRSSEAVSLFEEACSKYSTALEKNPNSTAALLHWAEDLGNLAMLKGIEEGQRLLKSAFEKYETVLAKNSELYTAYNGWAIALWNYGNLNSGKEAEAYYKKSFSKFDEAIKAKPDSAELYTNKAICMSKVAALGDFSKAKDLNSSASEAFKKALAINPKLFEAYYFWGIALRNQAEAEQTARTEDLYIQALKQFEKAMKTKPERHKKYREWDSSISNLSENVYEEEPERLYQETFKKYQAAIFTERSSLELYNNYDVNLTMSGNDDPHGDYEKLYSEVVEK